MTMITERGSVAAPDPTGSRIKVRVITAGIGSSGTYPAEAIESAAPHVQPGIPVFADHPTVTEGYERPERSVRDLVGFFETPGTYVKESGEHAVDAEVSVLPQWREAVAAMAPHIGLSIRAQADVDESQGKRVIKRITAIESVDLVTKAGRGGKVLELLESARPNVQVAETTVNDLRSLFERAVTAAHGDATVEDHDDQYVYFTVWPPGARFGDREVYRQSYTATDTTVTLTGEREPVTRTTEYKPVGSDQKEATSVANTQEATASNNNTGNGSNGGGGNQSQDPKDKRIAELEAQVADLKAQLKAAKNPGGNAGGTAGGTAGKGGAKESAHNDDEGDEVTEAQGEQPGIDYDRLAEALARHNQGQGTITGMGHTNTPRAVEAGITDHAAIISALHGGN